METTVNMDIKLVSSERNKEELDIEPINNESYTKASEYDKPGRCSRRSGLRGQIKKIVELDS